MRIYKFILCFIIFIKIEVCYGSWCPCCVGDDENDNYSSINGDRNSTTSIVASTRQSYGSMLPTAIMPSLGGEQTSGSSMSAAASAMTLGEGVSSAGIMSSSVSHAAVDMSAEDANSETLVVRNVKGQREGGVEFLGTDHHIPFDQHFLSSISINHGTKSPYEITLVRDRETVSSQALDASSIDTINFFLLQNFYKNHSTAICNYPRDNQLVSTNLTFKNIHSVENIRGSCFLHDFLVKFNKINSTYDKICSNIEQQYIGDLATIASEKVRALNAIKAFEYWCFRLDLLFQTYMPRELANGSCAAIVFITREGNLELRGRILDSRNGKTIEFGMSFVFKKAELSLLRPTLRLPAEQKK